MFYYYRQHIAEKKTLLKSVLNVHMYSLQSKQALYYSYAHRHYNKLEKISRKPMIQLLTRHC